MTTGTGARPSPPGGAPVGVLLRLYWLPYLVLTVGLAAVLHSQVVPIAGPSGRFEATATVAAVELELRLEQLPRTLSSVFERSMVAEEAHQNLGSLGIDPPAASAVRFEPLEGTPFGQVIAADHDEATATAIALAYGEALVNEVSRIGPALGTFTLLTEVSIGRQEANGLPPEAALVVALAAAALLAAAVVLAWFSVARPAIEGMSLPYPIVVVTNVLVPRDVSEVVGLFGIGRVADLVLGSSKPTYLASLSVCRSFRTMLWGSLARSLRVPTIGYSPEVAADKLALGEIEVRSDRDVGHKLIGLDYQILLVAREGRRLGPLLAAAEQFGPDRIIGLVIERRARRMLWRGLPRLGRRRRVDLEEPTSSSTSSIDQDANPAEAGEHGPGPVTMEPLAQGGLDDGLDDEDELGTGMVKLPSGRRLGDGAGRDPEVAEATGTATSPGPAPGDDQPDDVAAEGEEADEDQPISTAP